MRKICAAEGCEHPVGRNRSKWCGPQHAYEGRLAWMRQWNTADPRRVAYRQAHNREYRRRTSRTKAVDRAAVLRAMRGEAMPLNRQERRLAIAELHRRGLSTTAIAERLRVSRKTVQRHRVRIRQEQAA